MNKLAAKTTGSIARADLEHAMWKNWIDNKKSPEFFQPLRKKYEPLLRSTTNQLARNPHVPKPAIEHEVNKLFVQACESFNPSFGTALNTHVHTTLQKAQRFVNDHTGSGHIPEPRQKLIQQFKNSQDELHELLGETPSLDQIANHMNAVYLDVGRNIQVTVPDLERLHKELSRKDLTQDMGYGDEDTEFMTTAPEHSKLLMMHYLKTVPNGSKDKKHLTEDEHKVFKVMFPLSEHGTVEDGLKPLQVANHLGWKPPKVSRAIKGINEKLLKLMGTD